MHLQNVSMIETCKTQNVFDEIWGDQVIESLSHWVEAGDPLPAPWSNVFGSGQVDQAPRWSERLTMQYMAVTDVSSHTKNTKI